MFRADKNETLVTLVNRLELLDRLCQSPAHIRDLIDETGQARSTVHRAVNELSELDLLYRGDDGIEATIIGRFARDQLTAYLDGLDDIFAAHAVLEPLPAEADIEHDIIRDAACFLAADPTPYRPSDRMHEDLTEAKAYRALLSTVEASRTIRVLYQHVVIQGNPAEIVVSQEVFRMLRNEFPRRMTLLAEAKHFDILVGKVPPYTLGLLEHQLGTGSGSTTVHAVIHNDNGGIHGLVVNKTEHGISWATAQYEQYRNDATDRTGELIADTDGGTQTLERDGVPMIGQSLPPSLEREGFTRVDAAYFRNEPVSKPTTAWRAGLSLAEVHTGYAITRPGSGPTEESTDERRGLAAEITDELRSGDSVVVLGPPGSGKSTVCKQVACQWYEEDRGPVLYRAGNHDQSISSIDDLVATVTNADGHALVVIEDAVRPSANAIFEALEHLTHHDSVSVLLDSRESEWRDQLAPATDVSALEITYVPRIEARDCVKLVDHFERTVGRSVEVPTDRLWSVVRDEAVTDDGKTHEMLRLIHRLATYADPLAAEPTALEEEVASVYADLSADDLARSVCLLVNTLNAAGIRVNRGLCYAVAGDVRTGGEGSQYGPVDDALDQLSGRVLFPGQDGGYRIVHEEWSMVFLHHILDVEGEEEAAKQFGTVVSALLRLAEDPERYERIGQQLDGDGQVGFTPAIDESPTWADETVKAIYDLCRRRSTLTPLFGDGAHDSIDLPAACTGSIAEERPLWLGEAFLTGGYYDHAERAFERVPDTDIAGARDGLLGLARVAFKRGAYDEAISHHETGLSTARTHDDLVGEARHLKGLGLVEWRLGSYERARESFEACQECARQLGDRNLASVADANLGAIAWSQGAYERARDHFEVFLQFARDTGDRAGEATSLNNIGSVAYHQGAYDRAQSYFEESLTIRREIGYRSGEASCLNNLGLTASKRGATQEAEDFHGAALEISTTIDHSRERGHSLWGLGIVAREQEDYQAADAFFEEALETFDETGNQSYMARTKLERATLALACENLSEARKQTEEVLAVVRKLEEDHVRARCLNQLGRIAAANGNLEEATAHWQIALEEFEDRDSYDLALETLEYLVGASLEEGDTDEVSRWLERAQELLGEAPAVTSDLHSEWVDREINTIN